MSLVRTRDLGGGYAPGQNALDGVTFAVEAGEAVGILGPNGGGKTTLFRALLGELPHRHGSADVVGRPAYVPQTERARLDFPVSALDVALMGAFGRTPWYRRLARADRHAAAEALERVGLGERLGHRPNQLSGGERQRVAIARAVVARPQLVLADEPTGNLDSRTGESIVELLHELRATGTTIVVITHDRELAAALPRQIGVRDGRLEDLERRPA